MFGFIGNTSGSPQSTATQPYNQTNDTDYTSNIHNTVIISGVMFGAGVLGNILALVVLIRPEPEQKRTIFYRLVAGLCITDFLGITLTSPVVIAVYVNNLQWIGGTAMCNYFGYVMIFASFATMLIVCSMSIERVFCIVYPLIYNTRSSTKHATMILIFCWTIAACFAALPFLGFGQLVLHYPRTWCFVDYFTNDPVDKVYNYLFASLAIAVIIVTVCCNLTVMSTLTKRQCQHVSKYGRSKYGSNSKRFNECQMLVQLVGVTIVFSACYMPLMARTIINQTGLLPRNFLLDLFVIRIASLNQILDPWVYILLRRELLWKVISGFKTLCRIGQNQLEDINPTKCRLDIENDTCCIFCYHCLCDPPRVKRPRPDSMYSMYSYDLENLHPSTPTLIRSRSLHQNDRDSYISMKPVNISAQHSLKQNFVDSVVDRS